MKIELKGIVKNVTGVTTKSDGIRTNNFQSLIVTVPGYVDSFGEKQGKDEDWEVQLINDSITKHKLLERDLLDKKVIVSCYLNSRGFKANGEDRYALNLNLAGVELFQPKQQ